MVRQRIEGRAPDLALVTQSGQPLTLRELHGKVVLLTFTYSTCAEVCPLITAAMVTLQQRLTAAERQQVFFLSVTAQPEVDTPAVLQAYAHRLGVDLASWAGSVLNVEMTVKTRGFTDLKTEACGLTQEAYLHF
jgi:cytochrome oxidase Cu insertion factor (SCO1/SenC/PrrC family)